MAGAQKATGMKIAFNGYVVAETTDVTPSKFSRAKDIGTGHESSAVVHCAGMPEWSDMTHTCYAVDDAAQVAIEALRDSGASGWWKVIRPATWKVGGTVTPFKTDVMYGWISGWDPITPLTGRATYKLTITPEETVTTGITTLGAGLSALSFKNQADESITAFIPTPFAATTYKYAVTAFSDDTGIKITPTGATGTIYVNGTLVESAGTSAAITLGSGTTTIFVMVVESDLAKTPRIYQIDVTIGTVASPA